MLASITRSCARNSALARNILSLRRLAAVVVPIAYWLGVVIVSMYFAMLAAAWNLLAGYTGQFSLAPATFGMIGAYATGLLSYHSARPPSLGLPAAAIVAGRIGLVLGRIVLRLRGPYLALTTLSFAEIMRLVISNSIEITRGDLGLNVPGIFQDRLPYYYMMLAVLVFVQVGPLSAAALPRPDSICERSATTRSRRRAAASTS